MDSAMRDLDQLRERGEETAGRKLIVVALGTLVVVAAVFAMGILVGSSDAAQAPPATDPLAQLDRAAGTEPPPAARQPEGETAVETADLSFPSSLTTDPLVEAAVRAAAREHEALERSAGTDGTTGARAPSTAALDPAAFTAGTSASGEGARLARVAQHDALVAAALPHAAETQPATTGRPGKFTLQVVSYQTRREADEFAEALRDRGHRTFVLSADVPDRGRYYRVRIGPFDTRREAMRYQAQFERDEQMHTLVVRNDDSSP